MKYLSTLLSVLVIFSSSAFAKKLDVGVNIPANLGETFTEEKVSYEQFKGQPFYMLVWDSANKQLLRDVLIRTEDSPAPVVVMCLGRVKVGSRRKDYTECEYQADILNDDRVTLIKNKRNRITKSVKLPQADHLFVIDNKGVVAQKIRLFAR